MCVQVLAGFIDLVASLKPRSMQAYVKRVNPEGIVRDYGFDDLVRHRERYGQHCTGGSFYGVKPGFVLLTVVEGRCL